METARCRVRLFNDYARFLLMTTNVTTMIAISTAAPPTPAPMPIASVFVFALGAT